MARKWPQLRSWFPGFSLGGEVLQGEGPGRHQGGWGQEHLQEAEDLLQDEDLEVEEDLLRPEDVQPHPDADHLQGEDLHLHAAKADQGLVEDPDLLLEDIHEDLQDLHRVEDLFLLYVVAEILHHQDQIVPVKLPK